MAEYPFRQLKTVEDEERCVVNSILKSTRYKNKWAARVFKFFEISHVSGLFGANPFSGKVESEQETVVIKEKELNCNLENKSSPFFFWGGTSITVVTFNVSSK